MSGAELSNDFEREQYEITLGYLSYDEGQSDKLSFPVKVRERYLTSGPSDATLQGIGPELQVTIWSERDNIVVRLPLTEWRATRPYKGTLTGPNNGILSVGRFEEELDWIEFEDEKGIHGFLWTHNWPQPGEDE